MTSSRTAVASPARGRTRAVAGAYRDYRVWHATALCLALAARGVALVLVRARWLAPAPGRGARSRRAPTSRPPLLGGVNIGGLELRLGSPAEADRAIAARAGSCTRRSCAPTSPGRCSSRAAPGSIDPRALAFTDRLVGDAAAAGIRVIMTVDSTPCWASSAPRRAAARHARPDRASAGQRLAAARPGRLRRVRRLPRRSATARELAAIEVWNEPDQANEALLRRARTRPQRYAAILRAAYPAIKQANPGVPVLGGSLVGSNGVFLRALYAAGIKGYYDGLSVHFYTLTLASLRAIHEVQLANGDTHAAVARRVRLEQLLAAAADRAGTGLRDAARSRRRTCANIVPRAGARAATWPPRSSTSCRTRAPKTSACSPPRGARKPAFAALAGVLAAPFGTRPARSR